MRTGRASRAGGKLDFVDCIFYIGFAGGIVCGLYAVINLKAGISALVDLIAGFAHAKGLAVIIDYHCSVGIDHVRRAGRVLFRGFHPVFNGALDPDGFAGVAAAVGQIFYPA